MIRRGVAIVHYERAETLPKLIQAVKDTVPAGTRVVVCDDGSSTLATLPQDTTLLRGPRLGVGANKNRALWALQDVHFGVILEDDLIPKEKGWFEAYEEVSTLTGIHHFCRVSDEKLIQETHPGMTNFLKSKGYSVLYGSSPRGDFTFFTSEVIRKVGGFHPRFVGAGYAHGEWSSRVAKAGLIQHPLRWIDIKEARDKFYQEGDTSGGRWNHPERTKEEIKINKRVMRELEKSNYIYHPLVLV